LVVSGRTKDIIIRKGENISPKEVEDVLVEHPNIAEVAIIGLPDEERGERACAVIVPKHQPAPEVADVRAFLKTAVARLPKNDAGKVLKHAIKAMLLADESQSKLPT
jgi:acyl-CoA synthetase (AMP-forming)/AMP-acid ligase II